MRVNRRRHANVLPIASLATWILLAAFAAGAGLYYVYCKNQLHARGALVKDLEKEYNELRNQNEVVRSQIAKLSAPAALKKRREQDKKFLAEYTDITRDYLVVVGEHTIPGVAGEMRPVANLKP
jgi:cell division protein FtsB